MVFCQYSLWVGPALKTDIQYPGFFLSSKIHKIYSSFNYYNWLIYSFFYPISLYLFDILHESFLAEIYDDIDASIYEGVKDSN